MFDLSEASEMLGVIGDPVNKFGKKISQRDRPGFRDKRAIDAISLCAPFVFDGYRSVQHGDLFGFCQVSKEMPGKGAIERGDRNYIFQFCATVWRPQFKR